MSGTVSTRPAALGLALALLVHLLALYLPGSPEPSTFPIPGADKVVHVLLFAVPTLLLRQLTSRWWPIVALAVHAPVSELIQANLVPYRSGDGWDLAADLAGIGLGVGIGLVGVRQDGRHG